MSRFFNESRKVVQQIAPSAAKGNLAERVASLKADLEPRGGQSVDDRTLKPVLTPLEDSASMARDVVTARLQDCRSMRLPRDDERSLLTPDYNLSMQHALEAYQTLRTRLVKRQDNQGMRSLVVTSTGPAEGKTLNSFNLALCFARIQNWPVLLVDGDLRTRGISMMMGNPSSAGLADLLESRCSYESAILSTDVPNLYVLPAGKIPSSAPELFARSGWKEFIGWSAECFKLVLVDSPPILELADFELIAGACEGVLLVARSGKTSRESLARICLQVDPKKLLGIVLNGSAEKGEKGYYYRYTAL